MRETHKAGAGPMKNSDKLQGKLSRAHTDLIQPKAEAKPRAKGDWMTQRVGALKKVLLGKRRMVEKGIRSAVAKCPVCEADNTLHMALAPNRRDRSGYHIHAGCTACGFSMME
jgi:Zn ribbon nucleic-acid-binding protein